MSGVRSCQTITVSICQDYPRCLWSHVRNEPATCPSFPLVFMSRTSSSRAPWKIMGIEKLTFWGNEICSNFKLIYSNSWRFLKAIQCRFFGDFNPGSDPFSRIPLPAFILRLPTQPWIWNLEPMMWWSWYGQYANITGCNNKQHNLA